MSLRRRIKALEKKFEPPASGVCPRCGGPMPGQNMCVYVKDDGSLLFGECTSCGLALDEFGKPLHAYRYLQGPKPPTKRYHASVYGIV